MFLRQTRKTLILRELHDLACSRTLQNIVKEGLTRKLFNGKELRVSSRELRPRCGPYRNLLRCECARYLSCAFDIEGQGQMSQRMGVALWKTWGRNWRTGPSVREFVSGIRFSWS